MGIEAAGTFDIGGERTVHRLGFGAMRLCGPGIWGWPDDREGKRAVARRARELGVDFIDTADAYGPEVNEYQLAEALHPYDGLTIATKGGLVRGGPNDWQRDGRPVYLKRRVANSLRRLGVDAIDLYQLHAPDPSVPFADQVGALAEEKEAGRIRHVGLSNVSVEQLQEARSIVDIATVQNRFNLTDRKHEPVLRACEAHGIGFIPWYPLAAGPLAEPDGPVGRIASEIDCTPSQVALAWLLKTSPVILPIPGTGSVAHLEQNVGAADVVLSDAHIAQLDDVG